LKELISFFSGYFHQDWDLEASHPDDIVRNFIATTTGRNLRHVIGAQIENYLNSKPNEVISEDELYDELGCNICPSADGMTVRQWLTHVASMLLQDQ
jgi:hypothetical protein